MPTESLRAGPSRRHWRKIFRRRMREWMLKVLPRGIVHWWIRRSLDLAVPKASSSLRFEVVSKIKDLKEALALVQKNFEREGYTRDTTSVRLTPYHLLPESFVIVAKLDDRIVATTTVIPRTLFGVPLDGYLPLEDFSKDRGKIVEISALAVDREVRGQQGEVLYNLMKYMYHCNVELLNVGTEVIGVNPKMTALYEAILLFERIPGMTVSTYEFANGAPVVPMFFDLRTAQEAYGRVYRDKPARQNVMKFFLAPPPPLFSFPAVKSWDSILPQRNPEMLREILSWNPDVLNGLTDQQLRSLEDQYRHWPACAGILHEVAKRGK